MHLRNHFQTAIPLIGIYQRNPDRQNELWISLFGVDLRILMPGRDVRGSAVPQIRRQFAAHVLYRRARDLRADDTLDYVQQAFVSQQVKRLLTQD